MMDFFGQGNRKRGRDEDDEGSFMMEGVPLEKRQRNAPAELTFARRDIKPFISRAQTLPFRVDHPQAPLPPSPAFELPIDCDSPSATDPSGSNSPASCLSLPAPADLPDADMGMGMNMDEEVSIVGSASPPSPYQTQTWLRPAKLNSPSIHDQFSGGRIPTPIHSNFLIGAPPPSRAGTWSGEGNTESMLAPPRQRPHIFTNDYRMPSPISEDYIDTPTDVTSSQLSRLSFSAEDNMDMDMPIRSDSVLSDPVPDTPTRTGRARSGAISTISNGGMEKKKFVVGYREDCEKCRARMPGHWAHFLPV
ncbi:hypothetical protein EJ08DRAFT_118690 [Tothia fuscella]|uniref:Uncharacterized protein n=1 Tax=Tothia fuscella TaxID=1048955 RepID=A0A9P4NV43_9PEZI|nr:hypothetical protein EJ08DRAFT_118690 [Tothia fuscella]